MNMNNTNTYSNIDNCYNLRDSWSMLNINMSYKKKCSFLKTATTWTKQQCDQIWRNFDNLTKCIKSLAILEGSFNI